MNYQEVKELVSSLETSNFEMPIRIVEDKNIFLSKLNGLFCISYPDFRYDGEIAKKFNLSSEKVLKIIKNKLK